MSKKFSLFSFFIVLFLAFSFEASASPARKNERLVITSLRLLHSAQATYAATMGSGGYGSLAQLAEANFIDAPLAIGAKYGYVYQVSVIHASGSTPAAYSISARPAGYRKSGVKSFYLDQTGVLRGADKSGGDATVSDPIIDTDCVPFEECAKSSLRTLHSAQMTYAATSGNGNYSPSFQRLYEENLIPPVLRVASRAGYLFQMTAIAAVPGVQLATFTLRAKPAQYGGGTRRSFFMGTDGVLRGADKNGADADANDPVIEN